MNYLAFDVGGSSVKYAVIDEKGTFAERGSFVTPKDKETFFANLADVKTRMADFCELAGIGFSMPGAVDDESGVIGGSSALPYIHDFPIRQQLEQRLGLPAAMENDANCAALGEVWTGAGRDYQDVAFFVIGSGVGGALVHRKEIIHGAHLHGGEFGYMYIRELRNILSEGGCPGGLKRRMAKARSVSPDEFDGRRVYELRDAGDETAARIIDDMYEFLARAIYDIQYIFDPEAFLLGGAISSRSDLIPGIESHLDRIMKEAAVARIRPKILPCLHGNDANLLGAVCHFRSVHR
ncbi:ROK family protein [Selenomonas montiformis]|uniref:ROK family protein n=1 Tax=Selenomonas montiformis TaxID=2652285 RepID=A0A6I2UZ13_9FIRM|nr:ROK family protein [Selenomonas montiformis]MDY4696351.1 ROK family protein [Selenomonas montiformis]MSV25595.1 ROK family protein [Selenomonas montiformis]